MHRASEGGVSSPLLQRARGEKQVEYLDLDLHTGRSTPARQVTPLSFSLQHVTQITQDNKNICLSYCAALHVCYPGDSRCWSIEIEIIIVIIYFLHFLQFIDKLVHELKIIIIINIQTDAYKYLFASVQPETLYGRGGKQQQ